MNTLPEAAPDGTAWLIPGEDDRYHLLHCMHVKHAADHGTLTEVEIAGPETLAGRTMCHACARRVGHDAWPPAEHQLQS